MPQSEQIVQVLPRDAIPAIDRPAFEPVMKARNFDANELMTVRLERCGVIRWRVSDGEAIDGPLKDQRLTRAVAHPAFWFGRYGFFPDSAVWQLSR